MKRLLAVIAAIVVAVAASCGSGTQSTTDGGSVELQTALAQLEQLETPSGANPEQFAELKRSLATALRSGGAGKFTAEVPSGASGEVIDLVLNGSGGFFLEWTYRNKGDYDQNKQVTINDLSALGANLGKTPASPDWLSKAIAADGDGNGEVNVSDITPIGANLLATVTRYEIQTTDTPGDEGSWQDFDEQSFETSSIPPGSALRRFSYNFAPSPNSWYRVVPVDGEQRGVPSNAVQYALAGPDITSVAPTSGLAETGVTFSAVRSGGTPTSWSWDFGGGATPGTSTLAQPSVTLGAAGVYNASLTVSNPAGSDTFDFTLTVTNPPAPVVDNVEPQSGVEGAQISFTPTLSGGPVATYAWDFGGGATPNTDTTQMPFVTLGSAGLYPASLTVTNAGGSDTFDFILTVTPGLNNPPTASFTATPQDGLPGDPVQLDAIASTDSDGTIAKYEWDLDGDGIFETDDGGDTQMTTALPNPEGTVDVSLRVTDNGGAIDTATRTLSSDTTPPEWQITQVHSTNNGVEAPFLAEVNGLPAITFGETYFGGNRVVTFARADTDDGSNGFNMVEVTQDPPVALSIAEVNGTPAIAYLLETDSSLKYAYTSTSDGSGSWSNTTVANAEVYGGKVSLAEINGKPSIAYFSKTSSAVLFARSADDDGNSNWSSVTVDGSNAIGASLALVNGKPAIAYTTADDPALRLVRFAYSSMDDGNSGWTSLSIPGTEGADWTKQTLRVVGGFPAILFGKPDAKGIDFAHSTVADGSSGWATQESGMGANSLYQYPQSLAFAGLPYSALITTSDEVSVGVNTEPDGTGAWTETVIDGGVANPSDGVTIASINGHPAVAYRLNFQTVMYAIYK